MYENDPVLEPPRASAAVLPTAEGQHLSKITRKALVPQFCRRIGREKKGRFCNMTSKTVLFYTFASLLYSLECLWFNAELCCKDINDMLINQCAHLGSIN